MTECVVFLNVRRTTPEARAALIAARRLGYDVVLLSDRPPLIAPGLYRRWVQVDTYNTEAVITAARKVAAKERIRGVITWADRDVETVARVATEIGLPGISVAAAQRARDKVAMKRALEGMDEVPRHAGVRTRGDLEVALATVGLPGVLKPAGASGSKGIHMVADQSAALLAFDQLMRYTRPEIDPVFQRFPQQLIYEEWLDGPEYSVEGWVHAGAVVIAGITAKQTSEPWHLETEHIHPAPLSTTSAAVVRDAAVRVVARLGLDWCGFHLEGKLTPGGFRFIEVAARTGGDYIGSHLLPLSGACDFYDALVRVATGEKPDPPQEPIVVAGVRFLLAPTPGYLRGIDGLTKTLAHPEVEHVFVETAVDSPLLLPPQDFSSSRVAAVIARAGTTEAVATALNDAAAFCHLMVTGYE